ncbi:hypothetical protein HQ393_02710 [Chitinibacter bivalviorum]|uniref:SprA family protein n=1 Tax=Chitinibacter bivalviorum TaxID=2739434 RepID=A0A7H9BMU9_9NEIS|nr:putative metalloprotease CJM1_0395 family protein [Chitinibacter bivalviorum]QLG89799.1 hypothetical protein HQ393_02710 [Chitinibacter bivalviorum]
MINAVSSSVVNSYRPATSSCGPGCTCAACLQANQANASAAQKAPNGQPLTSEQVAQLSELKKTDAEVRRHEQAHLAASGGLAKGGPSYSLKTGPDGQQYAVGGEVQIDTSPGKTPEETLRKARIIRAAALAPAEPSGPDQAVAAKAQSMEQQALQEIAQRSPAQQKLASAYQQQPQLGLSHFQSAA